VPTAPLGVVSCGADQNHCSVLPTRSQAAARVTQPRSAPMGYAVSAKPVAATLANERVGQRSGVRPRAGSLWSQNHQRRAASMSRKAVLVRHAWPASSAVSRNRRREHDRAAHGHVALSLRLGTISSLDGPIIRKRAGKATAWLAAASGYHAAAS
jgi:hypothetical protein